MTSGWMTTLALANLAQTAPDSVFLVAGDPPSPTGIAWWVLPLIFTCAAAAAGFAVAIWHTRRLRARPGEFAFRQLARRLKLRPAQVALVRRMAATSHGITPAAILLSDEALRSAAASLRGEKTSGRELRVLELMLATRLGKPGRPAPSVGSAA